MAEHSGTIVVIEDEPHISDLVAMYLQRDGFRVLQAGEGTTGLALAERERPRLVIIDIGLPGELDGLDVCRRLRRQGDVPVVLLTARDEEVDRILGLELGADDYVTKPFSARELVARVHAVLRRSSGSGGIMGVGGGGGVGGNGNGGGVAGAGGATDGGPVVYEIGQVKVDLGRREVRTAAGVIALATREFDLLAFLSANRGLALTRQQLLDGVWGLDWYGDARTVDVHVGQLRKKLGDALTLTTVWGVGYRLD